LARSRDTILADQLSGTQSGLKDGRAGSVVFRPTTLLALLVIGLFSFAALIVLSGFADDLRRDPPGQATPRSVSAVGYKAIVDLLTDLDYDVRETRGDRPRWQQRSRLVLYTPASRSAPLMEVRKKAEDNEISLIVLPKWSVSPMIAQPGETSRRGWVRKTTYQRYYTRSFDALIADLPPIRRQTGTSFKAEATFDALPADSTAQGDTINVDGLQYFVTQPDLPTELADTALTRALEDILAQNSPPETEEGTEETSPGAEEVENKVTAIPVLSIDSKAVLIRLDGTNTFVLSEPDLLNTAGLETRSGANVAVNLINEVISQAEAESWTVDIDFAVHGLTAGRNVVKLMLTPPFLAATLCLLAAGGLVAWQGFNRFGDPETSRPDYAQGPVSLARTAAEFMKVAGRAHRTGASYAALIRRQVAATLGYRARDRERLDALLDGRERRQNITPGYHDLAQALETATPEDYAARARALDGWRRAMISETPKDRPTQEDTT